MADILFTSDDHIDHQKVAEMRGFVSIEEYREWFCDRWVSSVRKNDIVFNLGDLTLASVSSVLPMYEKLPGTKHLIWGNHDQGWPHHKKAYNFQKKYLRAFESANSFQRIKTHGMELLLTHFPYQGEHSDHDGNPLPDRHTEYRLPDIGLPNVHGHVHAEWLVRKTENGTLMVNVGVDRWMEHLPTIGNIIELVKGNKEID